MQTEDLTNIQSGTNMKIAQVSPLAERVPPIGYGGTERIVAYLSDELIRQGHELTLFASGDSLTKGLCPWLWWKIDSSVSGFKYSFHNCLITNDL